MGMSLAAQREPHVEVHKFYSGSVAGSAFLALLLQGLLPRYLAPADLLELPLLVTIYFALSRRNPSSGLLLGMSVGLLQDAISNVPLGLYGIAKTLVGYGGSLLGPRIDVEHPLSRCGLTFFFFVFHRAAIVLIRRLLLAQSEPFFTRHFLLSAVLCCALAPFLFAQLDRLRKPA